MHLAEDPHGRLELVAAQGAVDESARREDKREREREREREMISRFMKNPAVAKAESIRFDS